MAGKNRTGIIKLSIDVLMTVSLMLLMPYSIVGGKAHEWIGMGMFLLFVFHHILNKKWFMTLRKGKYTALRFLQTGLNLCILVLMAASMVSGILMSRYIFTLWNLQEGIYYVRMIHLLCAYWNFLLLSVHIGLHWKSMMLAMHGSKRNKYEKAIWFILGAVIIILGVRAFCVRKIGNYLLLKQEFSFFDMTEPLSVFLFDYFCIMGLFAGVGHYLSCVLKRWFP